MFEKIIHSFVFAMGLGLIVVGVFNGSVSSAWLVYAFISTYVLNLVLAFNIFLSDRMIDSKVSWVMFLFLLPIVGAVAYFVFGRPYKFNQARKNALEMENDLVNFENWNESKMFHKSNHSATYKLINKLSHRPVYTNSTIEYFEDGVAKFENLLKDLKEAKNYIHVMYFIIKESSIWDKIEEVLLEKARSGIEVKVLADGAGTFAFKRKRIKMLKQKGIDFQWYNKLTLSGSDNYRNHRKLVMIDGEIGYTGGINIGDEYIHKSEKFGYWRDTAIKLKGSALRSLQLIFLMDWKSATGVTLAPNNYLRYVKPVTPTSKTSIAIADDGPGLGSHLYKDVLVKQFSKATKRIWITTPYLVIPTEMISVLKIASQSGVDVRIIVPGKPDKKYVYVSTLDNARTLIRSGIKVYIYANNFTHAKQMIVDDNIIYGTANMDKRSFTQNYELFAFIKNEPLLNKLEDEFEVDFRKSSLLDRNITTDMRISDGLKTLLIKLLSPLF